MIQAADAVRTIRFDDQELKSSQTIPSDQVSKTKSKDHSKKPSSSSHQYYHQGSSSSSGRKHHASPSAPAQKVCMCTLQTCLNHISSDLFVQTGLNHYYYHNLVKFNKDWKRNNKKLKAKFCRNPFSHKLASNNCAYQSIHHWHSDIIDSLCHHVIK